MYDVLRDEGEKERHESESRKRETQDSRDITYMERVLQEVSEGILHDMREE